jgi:hypothetical protein
VQGIFAAVGGWRTAILAVRGAAAAALLVGIGLALPVVEVDLVLRYGPPVLAPLAQVAWWAGVARQPAAEAVLLLAAAGVAVSAYRKTGQFDSVSLAMTALGWSFAFLPVSSQLGVRSPAFDGALVVGFAGAAVALAGNVSGRLSFHGRLAIFGFLIVAGLVVLQALLTDSVRADAVIWVPPVIGAIAAAMIVALVAGTAWQFLPWVMWHSPLPGRAIQRALLVSMPAVQASGVVLAAAARQTSAATILAGLLGVALLAYGAILVALRVRRPLRIGGEVHLDRPPARVFRELTDLQTPLADGSPERRLEPLDDGPVGAGCRLSWHTQDQQVETAAVTAFEPPALFEYEMNCASYGTRVWFGIEPTEGGGSRVRWRQRLDLPLYWWMLPSYRRRLDGLLADTAERLRAGKRFLDDEATGPAPAAH